MCWYWKRSAGSRYLQLFTRYCCWYFLFKIYSLYSLQIIHAADILRRTTSNGDPRVGSGGKSIGEEAQESSNKSTRYSIEHECFTVCGFLASRVSFPFGFVFRVARSLFWVESSLRTEWELIQESDTTTRRKSAPLAETPLTMSEVVPSTLTWRRTTSCSANSFFKSAGGERWEESQIWASLLS